MRFLVTGANGYLGSHTTQNLLKNGHEVYAVDICNKNIDNRAKYINCDILDNSDYNSIPEIDVCIHFAWRDGFVHNSPRQMGDLSSHYRFLTHLISNGLKQLVVMGSMHEVGYHEGAINENTPCNPLSAYGIAKNALRQSLQLFIKDKSCTLQWIRGFYIFGDDLRNHSIFTKLLEASAAGKKTFPFTTGKNKYDFLNVDDLVKQIVAVAEQTEVDGIINCCSGNPVSLADAVESFIKDNNLDIKLEYGAFPDRPYDSPCVYGDNTKIKQICKY